MLGRALGIAALGALLAAPARAQAPQDCERCHSSREFLLHVASGAQVAAGLVVTRAALTGGPHAKVACAACHTGVQSYPHEPGAALNVRCGSCHAAQDSLWRGGVHSQRSAEGPRAGCVACHGGHDIAQSGFLPTAAGRTMMRAACARCHPQQVQTAARDVHADSIPCTSCHGAHDMRPVPDAATRNIDVRLARACSACHAKEAASYWRDIHGRTAVRQAGGAPIGADTAATCISCHGEHGIRHAADPAWRTSVADACTRCHELYGASYRDSYHGQASRVGSLRAAQCADCHTPHAVFPASDTASSVSASHRLGTCRRCHIQASAGFAGYRPHANPRSRAQNPPLFYVWAFMNVALFGTMMVWGTHTVLWYRRSMRDRRARPKGAHPPAPKPLDAALRGGGPFVWRFNTVFRIVHAMVVATFFLLVITGLPLLFSCTPWAPGLMRLLGGTSRAGLLHRISGAFVFGYFGIYVAYVTYRLWTSRDRRRMLIGADSILFRAQDLRDAFAMVKYFLGRGPEPRFGRYSYMEKFDYFAELWGVGAIGFTGLMLWQPVFFAQFFPGIMFNVAIIIHSYEAMIATAFIFVIHFFNVHLRPGKWPLDAVMLTGRASLKYMEEEHPLLAMQIRETVTHAEPSARAVADLRAPAAPAWLNRFAAVSGLILLGIGTALIGMILWGSVC